MFRFAYYNLLKCGNSLLYLGHFLNYVIHLLAYNMCVVHTQEMVNVLDKGKVSVRQRCEDYNMWQTCL